VGFGTELQQERESRGVALESIASGTKVSLRHLRALETGSRSDLPGGIFNKGILRSYCRYVGLEEHVWLERFATSDLSDTSEPDWSTFAEGVRRTRLTSSMPAKRGWMGVALMIAALFVLAWAAWRFAIQPRVHWQRHGGDAENARLHVHL
jgi:cytoskeletal protein RodZ